MDTQNPDELDERLHAETPEDVAVLYSWANLQGAKYRDFSAARREYRAQMRKRAAEAQREAELRAKAEAEASAAAAERAAREAEEAARFHESEARKAVDELRPHDSQVEQQAKARAIQHAAELSRRAAAERMEAARRAEAVAAAEAAARREAREMAEARASAERQAQRYAESESIRRALAGPQPEPMVHGAITDPYTEPSPAPRPERIYKQPVVLGDDMKPTRLPTTREERYAVPQPEDSTTKRADQEYWESLAEEQAPEQHTPNQTEVVAHDIPLSPVNYYYEPDSQEKVAAVDQYAHYARFNDGTPRETARDFYEHPVETPVPSVDLTPKGYRPDESSGSRPAFPGERVQQSEFTSAGSSVPQWLNSPEEESHPAEPRLRPLPPPVADTLHHSRERVAARWFALKGIFDQGVQEMNPEAIRARHADDRTPVIAIFSIAGGVGKTSMVATLGRALSASGEQVLLVDTTSHGLLPYYFGASELRPNVVRTFSPPSGHSGSPLALVGFDVAGANQDPEAQERFMSNLERNASHVQRVLVDLSSSSAWVMKRLARMNSIIVVPVSPDMNSVISLGPVEKFFANLTDGNGRSILPFYLLNQFDAALPLHLDVREVMRQQLGDRLLPFVVRRSPTMAESLAEGMTVIDYAPDSAVAGDYVNLANWLRTQSSPIAGEDNNAQWSER